MTKNSSPKAYENRESMEKITLSLTSYLSEFLSMRLQIDLRQSILSRCVDTNGQAIQTIELTLDENMQFAVEARKKQNTNLKNIKSEFYQYFGKKVKTTETVRDIIYVFLDAYRSAYSRLVTIGDSTYDWLDDGQLDLLASVATAVYLELWLAKDKQARQSLYQFVSRPYDPIVREKNNAYNAPDPTSRTQLERAYSDAYSVFEGAKRHQQKDENVPISHRRYVANGKRLLDFVTLAWCDAWARKYTRIANLLFFDDMLVDPSAKVNNSTVQKLHRSFSGYHKLIEETKTLGEQCNLSIVDTRKFVSQSMLLHGLERTYRFQLCALMAQKLCTKEVDATEYNKDIESIFIARYVISDRDGYMFLPRWHKSLEHLNSTQQESFLTGARNALKDKRGLLPEAKKYYRFEDVPLDVLSNDYYVQNIFQTNGAQQSKVEFTLHRLRRMALKDALSFISLLYRPELQPPWTERIFRDASVFYKVRYPVAAALLEPQYPDPNGVKDSFSKMGSEEIQKFYDYLRGFYVELYSREDGGYRKARETVNIERSKNKNQKKRR